MHGVRKTSAAARGLATGRDGVQVVERPESHRVPGLLGGAAHVRQQEDIVQLGEPGVDVGFVLVDVEAGGGEFARARGDSTSGVR